MAWSTTSNRGYHTTAHQRWRRTVLTRDQYTCQACGYTGQPKDGLMQADHIHNIAEGGLPYDPDNGQTLCTDCHTKKTQGEARRARIKRSNIRPTKRHPALPG